MVFTNMQVRKLFQLLQIHRFSLQSAHSRDNEFCCLGFVVMAILAYIIRILDTHNFTMNWTLIPFFFIGNRF